MIAQNPKPGTRGRREAASSTFTVSKGIEAGDRARASTGKSQSRPRRRSRTRASRCRSRSADQQRRSRRAPSSTAIPPGGSQVPVGSTVTLIVSSGPELVTVPDVKGMTEADAQAALTDAGLRRSRSTSDAATPDPAHGRQGHRPVAGGRDAGGQGVDGDDPRRDRPRRKALALHPEQHERRARRRRARTGPARRGASASVLVQPALVRRDDARSRRSRRVRISRRIDARACARPAASRTSLRRCSPSTRLDRRTARASAARPRRGRA